MYDLAAAYLTNRMNRATEPFTDPSGYMERRLENRFGVPYETEEERRRRLEREAQERGEPVAGPVAPPKPSTEPVKQTTTFDPVTGEQKIKVEGPAQAFSAANPNTPTLTMPGQPVAGPMAPADFTGPSADEVMRDQEMARIMAQGPQAPVAPVSQPAAPPTQMAARAPTTQTDVTAPMMGAQPPQRPVTPAVPAAQPEAPQQPLGTGLRVPGMPPSPQQTAQSAQQTAAAVQAQPAMNYQNILVAASQDPNALMRASEQVGGNWGRVYAATAKEQLTNAKNQQAGEAQGETAAATGRGVDRIMRRDPEPNSVGFYAKQYLLRRLGMGKEADELLGKTTFSFQNVTGADGAAYSLKMRGDGMAMAGYDSEGKEVDNKTLAALASQSSMMKGAQVGTSTFTDPVTGQTLSKVDTPQGPVYFDKARNRVIPKGEPIPNTTGANIPLQQKLADMRIAETIIKKGVTNLQDAKAQYIERVGPFGSASNRLTEEEFNNIYSGQISATGMAPRLSGEAGAPGPATPAPTPAAGGTAAAATQPAQARPPAGSVAGPVAPTAVPAPARPAAGGGRFVTKPQTEVSTAAATAEAKVPAEERGKIQAKDIKNQAYADSTYGLVRTINDEIKKSTGSGIGAGVDVLAGLFGKGTEGAQAIAKLEILKGPILANVPRFEGPQSDRDVAEYQRQAGDFANAKKPIEVRLAALDAMITILKKYDKAGTNDWTFGAGQTSSSSGTTSSGNRYKRVQ